MNWNSIPFLERTDTSPIVCFCDRFRRRSGEHALGVLRIFRGSLLCSSSTRCRQDIKTWVRETCFFWVLDRQPSGYFVSVPDPNDLADSGPHSHIRNTPRGLLHLSSGLNIFGAEIGVR